MASAVHCLHTSPPRDIESSSQSPSPTSGQTDLRPHHSLAGDTPSRTNLTSPPNRSRSFSISDILSDEVGSRKRPANIINESREKQSRVEYTSVSPESTAPSNFFPLNQSSQGLLSPINMYSALQQQMKGLTDWQTTTERQRAHGMAGQVYPTSYKSAHPVHLITSPTTVPSPISFSSYHPSIPGAATYNSHLAAAAQMQQQFLAQQQMMAAVVSQHHQHQSSVQQQQRVGGDRTLDQMPNTKPGSKQDGASRSNSEGNMDENANSNTYCHNHDVSTPILLKNRRKTMKPVETSQDTPTCLATTPEGPSFPPGYPRTHYSCSPLKPPNTTFSPSIFLTHPSTASISQNPNDLFSPNSIDNERRTGTDERGAGTVVPNLFMTSTPIRRGEKASFVSPNHTNSPISSGRREDRSTSEYHSSSDSEVPLLRRPRVPRKRTKPKTCTSLSPLLENTNPSPMNPANTVPSSRHTPSHPPPSSLLTSYTALPTSVAAAITGSGGGTMYHNHSINDSGFVSDTSHSRIPLTTAHHENVAYHYQPPLRYQHHQPNNSNHNTSSENIYETPVKNMARHTGATPTVANGKTRYPDNWGSSPFTDHLRKTGQIQSVPPWFVCSDKRSDGKRLRLTEAINKSLMETPSHKSHQLPAEWQKYAYGQTEDQKDLTQKARSFLRCRPRVLQFEKQTLD